MSRNYDWSPVGFYTGDPVPGVPSDLRTQVAKYKSIATNINDGANNLQAIINNCAAESEFVEAFAEQAEEVIGRLRKAKKKYSGFAAAIEGYIEPLSTARRESLALLQSAQTAQSDLAYAEKWARHYYNELMDPTTDPADIDDITTKYNRYEDDAADARGLLTSAESQIWAIIEACHKAAKVAADAIEETGDASGINDSGWVQFWEEHGEWIDAALTVLSVIGTVLLVVALIVPGLNVFVGAIILFGTIVAVAIAVNAVLQATAGTKSITDAIIEVALALVPLGIGKFLKPVGTLVQAGMNAGRPALMASSAAQGIRGVTSESAVLRISHLVADAKPAKWLFAALGESAPAVAQIQAIRNLTIGPSSLIDDALKGGVFAFALEGSPIIDLALDLGVGDLIKDGVNEGVSHTPAADWNYVSQPDSW